MTATPMLSLKKFLFTLVPSKTTTTDFASLADGEAFLPIPFKRNTEAPNTSFTSDITNAVSALSHGNSNSTPPQVTLTNAHTNNGNPATLYPTSHFTVNNESNEEGYGDHIFSDTFLNFKSLLMPYLLKSYKPNKPCYGDTLGCHNDVTDDKWNQININEAPPPASKLNLPPEVSWHVLNQLRIHAGAPERSEEGVEKLCQYYVQLCCLEDKFPFETEIKASFTWHESFHPKSKVTTHCIQYEKASVLFNVGALYSQLGSLQSLWDPEGFRKAAFYFQSAAGAFMYVRDKLQSRIKVKQPRSSDLSHYTLNALIDLMLAQAQECYYKKAEYDQASSALTSQIALQTSEYYTVVYRKSKNNNTIKLTRFPKEWPIHMKVKAITFLAIAHFHAPPSDATHPDLSERIARLEVAKEHATKARQLSGLGTVYLQAEVQCILEQITIDLENADTLNFERVNQTSFDKNHLLPIKKPHQPLVFPISFSPKEVIGLEVAGASSKSNSKRGPINRQEFKDLFEHVWTPLAYHDTQVYLQEMQMAAFQGYTQLSTLQKDIEDTIAQTPAFPSALNNMHEIIEDAKEQSGTLSSKDFVKSLENYRSEENLVPTSEILNCCLNQIDLCKHNLEQANDIINSVKEIYENQDLDSKFLEKKEEVSEVINQLQQQSKDLLGVHEAANMFLCISQKKLATNFDDFSPLSWNQENIKELLEPRNPVSTTKDMSKIVLDRELAIRQLQKVHRQCDGLLAELKMLMESSPIEKEGAPERVESSIHHSMDTFKNLTKRIKQHQSEKVKLFEEIENLNYRESKLRILEGKNGATPSIVNAFEKSFEEYVTFRIQSAKFLKFVIKARQTSVGILVRTLLLEIPSGHLPDKIMPYYESKLPRSISDPKVVPTLYSNLESSKCPDDPIVATSELSEIGSDTCSSNFEIPSEYLAINIQGIIQSANSPRQVENALALKVASFPFNIEPMQDRNICRVPPTSSFTNDINAPELLREESRLMSALCSQKSSSKRANDSSFLSYINSPSSKKEILHIGKANVKENTMSSNPSRLEQTEKSSHQFFINEKEERILPRTSLDTIDENSKGTKKKNHPIPFYNQRNASRSNMPSNSQKAESPIAPLIATTLHAPISSQKTSKLNGFVLANTMKQCASKFMAQASKRIHQQQPTQQQLSQAALSKVPRPFQPDISYKPSREDNQASSSSSVSTTKSEVKRSARKIAKEYRKIFQENQELRQQMNKLVEGGSGKYFEKATTGFPKRKDLRLYRRDSRLDPDQGSVVEESYMNHLRKWVDEPPPESSSRNNQHIEYWVQEQQQHGNIKQRESKSMKKKGVRESNSSVDEMMRSPSRGMSEKLKRRNDNLVQILAQSNQNRNGK